MSHFPLDPNLPAVETISPVGEITPTIREAVQRGAAWLDSVKPGWRTLIDRDAFDIADAHWCVLGQVFAEEAAETDSRSGVYNGYDYVLLVIERPRVRGGQASWMTSHGFDTDGTPTAYADLQAAWHRYLDGEW